MKVAMHGYHAGKAWLCNCAGVEPPFRNPGSATAYICIVCNYKLEQLENYIIIISH